MRNNRNRLKMTQPLCNQGHHLCENQKHIGLTVKQLIEEQSEGVTETMPQQTNTMGVTGGNQHFLKIFKNFDKLLLRKCILYILIATSIVEMIALLRVGIRFKELRTGEEESEFCNSLNDLRNENTDLKGHMIVLNNTDTDRNKICTKLSYTLKNIVQREIATRYNSDSNPEYVSLNLDAINCKASNEDGTKLHLDHIRSHDRPVAGKTTKVMWKHTSIPAERRLKHLHTEGVVIILESGLYDVSSLLTIRVQSSNTTTYQPDQTVRHVVYMISDEEGTEQVLLEHVKSICEMPVAHGDWSSSIGAIFYLEERERVYVATSHPYNLVVGHGKSYFSIYKMN